VALNKWKAKVRKWHFASFRCATEFGRYGGIADIDQNGTDQDQFMSTRLGSPRGAVSRLPTEPFKIEAIAAA